MAAPDLEQKAIGFGAFGGLRLDQALDEVGAGASIYEHDIDRDGSIGRFRSRDGFQKLNASAASGEYRGLYPHSALRLLAVRRVSSSEAKLVALDKEGTVKAESAALSPTEAPSTFASIGVPATSYTFFRSFVTTQKIVRFDGSTFTEPTATIENVTETGEKETPKTGKEMPKPRHMVSWPDASNVLVFANTTTTGGPNGAASSNSHVWVSKPGAPEAFEETAFIRLGVGDGEEITGICVYGAQLYVFKESKFWVVSPPSTNEHGQPVFSFREITLGQGSRIKQVLTEKLKETSDRICWASQDGVFFCTTDGIYQTRGGEPTKISPQLKPLEETVPFEGPMAEFLNGSTESFRWPATGILVLGRRIYVKRYEFMFLYDMGVETWTCWKMPSVSFCIWTGMTGGGAETGGLRSPAASTNVTLASGTEWPFPAKALEAGKECGVELFGNERSSYYLKFTNFGFAIPTGVTIVGVTAIASIRSANSAVIYDNKVFLVKGGAIQTGATNMASSLPWYYGTFGGRIWGGPEELWGTSLSPSEANVSEFGFALSVKNGPGVTTGDPFIQGASVQMQIFYLTAESASGVRPRLFCTQTRYVYWTGPAAEEQATFPGWAWQSGLYDLGSEDEKELVKAKLWASNQTGHPIKVATSEDFKALKERHQFEMGEETTQKSQNISQKATLFSHRLEGTGSAQIQKLVRYLRTTATSGSQSDPS